MKIIFHQPVSSQFAAMKNRLLFLFLLITLHVSAQSLADSAHPVKAGIELDVLPYALGGYFAAGFIAKGHLRARLLTASVHKPDITTNPAFTKHHIYAYALVFDYFLKTNRQGWWMGAGPVYWNSRIQSKSSGAEAGFHNWLLNSSIGYHYPIGRKLYCSPWAGLSFRVAGSQNTIVGTERFTLPFFNPEVSVKLGWVW